MQFIARVFCVSHSDIPNLSHDRLDVLSNGDICQLSMQTDSGVKLSLRNIEHGGGELDLCGLSVPTG